MLKEKLIFAARNLTTNKQRTLLALSAIIFGVIAQLLAGGFVEWTFWAMRESTIMFRLGHIQVVRSGYHDLGAADPFKFLLSEQSTDVAVLEQHPQIKVVAPRLAFTGLISYAENTVSFVGEGMDVAKEEQVGNLLSSHKSIGLSIRDSTGIVEGTGLLGSKPQGITIGAGLAGTLGVKPGDRVTLLSNTSTGGINAVEAEINGIFTTSNKQADDVFLRAPLPMAQNLLRVSGAHAWILYLDKTTNTDTVLHELKRKLSGQNGTLEFVPWYSLSDFYNKTVTLFSRQMNMVQIIIAVIIILSISNVLGMNVLERTSEIGTLMAIGLKRREILLQFLIESTVLGLLGASIGVVAGYGVAEVISVIGIPMPPAPGMSMGYTAEILITWPLAIGSLALIFTATVLAGVYPAWKASRLEIVDALRHSR
ncbi:FtsX-like permease family protein [Methylocaldum sp. MU1018]